MPREPEDLQRLHALSTIHQNAPFAAVENPAGARAGLQAACSQARQRESPCFLREASVNAGSEDGPLVLSADGATIDSCRFFNVLASNLRGTQRKRFSDVLRPWIDFRAFVICRDNASNMQAAARRLAEQSGINSWHCGTMNMGQSFCSRRCAKHCRRSRLPRMKFIKPSNG